jgi:hypothetical protein
LNGRKWTGTKMEVCRTFLCKNLSIFYVSKENRQFVLTFVAVGYKFLSTKLRIAKKHEKN